MAARNSSTRFRQLIVAALPLVARRAGDDACHLQLTQSAREQRARDAGKISVDLVEAVTARKQLAQDERRPAFGEHFAGHRHRAEFG